MIDAPKTAPKGFVWRTVLDDKTSIECRMAHGRARHEPQVYEADTEYRCRCWAEPVTWWARLWAKVRGLWMRFVRRGV